MVLPLARFVTFTSASAQDARSSDSQPKPKQACSPGATGLGFRVNHRNLASLDSADAVVLLVPATLAIDSGVAGLGILLMVYGLRILQNVSAYVDLSRTVTCQRHTVWNYREWRMKAI